MGKVTDIPTSVIRTHLQKWFIDSPTMTKDQDDDQKKTLAVWKEARCTCRWWATEALIPPSLHPEACGFEARWKPQMFTRICKTMFSCKWPERDETRNPTAYGKMFERTLGFTPALPHSRIRMEIWNTSPPDKCREWQSQIKVTDYDLVASCQNIAPEVMVHTAVVDSLSPMGLMRGADWAKAKGEKYEKVHTLCGWVGAREFDKEAWMDEWLCCFPNLTRLSLFFPFCTTVSNWFGITDCVHLRELRIDLINCAKTTMHIPRGLLAGDALPNLQILCISRMLPGHSLNLLEGRAALPELWLGNFNTEHICEVDISTLGEVPIGRLTVNYVGQGETAFAAVEGIVGSACHPSTELVIMNV